mmetsp:Transcript_75149/g.209019  ORF Transcript_75149/g.209019 Transcript_75149/m.209019 type:complete len:316 (+) Transcript_75149:90-1037(+)
MRTVHVIGLAALFFPASANPAERRALLRVESGHHVPSKLHIVQTPRRDVAFTGIFSFGVDPQRGKPYQIDDINHILPWYDSCKKLGMTCMVLHDHVFSPSFVSNFSTEGVSFHEMLPVLENGSYTDPTLEGLTPADMRFIELLGYLKSPEGSDIEYVVLTDGHDVTFRKDPLKLMRGTDAVMDAHYIFGQEEWRPRAPGGGGGKETALGRLVPYWKDCFGTDMPEEFTYGRMPNCGFIGGHRTVLIPFLERMQHWYVQVPVQRRFIMCDMLVFMRTVMEDYGDRIVTGYPFHSKFKNSDGEELAAIYHKSPDIHP